MLARLKNLFLNPDGTQDICITVDSDCSELFNELKDKEVDVQIKKHSSRRSLDANALCWYMIDQIAEKTKLKKSEVYRNAIKEIGGVSDIICVQDFAVPKLVQGWMAHGQGWQAEVTKSKLEGCSNVTLYYGSSVYDKLQMSNLIDSLIQDAEALGIPTPGRREIEKSMEIWTRKKEKENVKVDSAA